MGFIDTHVHLHFPDYDPDREEVIGRSRAAGVETFINIGTDAESSRAALALAESHDFIYATAGVHPHDVKDTATVPGPRSMDKDLAPLAHVGAAGFNAGAVREPPLQVIEELLKHPKMVAIGEVGLDFFRDHSPREKQKEVLREFVRMHTRVQKPLVLHCRGAYEELIGLLQEEMTPPFSGVIHCFSSDRPTMTRLVDLGFYISFAGPLTYKKNDALREACKACPLDRLLLETDAPFLPPQSVRGKRNESSFMLETAELAAGLHGISLVSLGERTSQNSRRIFGLCSGK